MEGVANGRADGLRIVRLAVAAWSPRFRFGFDKMNLAIWSARASSVPADDCSSSYRRGQRLGLQGG